MAKPNIIQITASSGAHSAVFFSRDGDTIKIYERSIECWALVEEAQRRGVQTKEGRHTIGMIVDERGLVPVEDNDGFIGYESGNLGKIPEHELQEKYLPTVLERLGLSVPASVNPEEAPPVVVIQTDEPEDEEHSIVPE